MNLSRVTLTQLGYLVAVEREKSFRDAAKRSFVTQPALSQQIGKLEEDLGVRVFDRSRQPVVPTEIGERILAQARAILREVERLEDVVAESAGPLSGRYRLGILPTLAPSLLPLFLPDFMRRHSLVELVVEEVTTEEMIERLRRDDLDGGLAATPLHTTEIAERPLYREPLHAYVSPGHRLARRGRIDQRELAKEPVWILGEGHCFREQVLQLCGPRRPVVAGESGAVAFESATFETLIGLVDRDFGLTVLPDLVVRGLPAAKRRARVRPFAPPVPSREVSLVSRRRHLRRAIADALAAAIEAAVPPELVASRRDRSRPLDPRPSGHA